MDRRLQEGPVSFREEKELSRSLLLRWLLLVTGTLAMVLGFVGVFLPVMPTTPFVLVAAACYARSSRRFYYWLLSNRYFGRYILAWRQEHRIPLHAKIIAVSMIVISVGASILWFVPLLAIKVLLAAIAIMVIGYICRQKS